MSRRTRTAATLLAALLLVSGCGVLRDEVAATVGSAEISTDEVAELAKSPLAQGSQDDPDGKSLAGDRQRAALAILVQDRMFSEELRRLGGKVTDADRQQASQQLQQIEAQGGKLSSKVGDLVERLVANQAAVLRLSLQQQAPTIDDAAVAAYFAAHRDEFPAELICLEGLVAPPTDLAGVRAVIEGGGSFDDAIATKSDEVFPIDQAGSSTCVAPGDITTPELAAIVEQGPIGELQEFATTGQVGEPVVLLIRVTSRDATTGTEPAVVSQIRQALEQSSQQSQQSEVASLLRKLIARSEVDVDPRYGRFDASTPTLIAAPAVPAAPTGAAATSPAAALGG